MVIKKFKKISNIDVISTAEGSWLYGKKVKRHFFHPKNFVKGKYKGKYDGIGLVGSPACGDMMKMWIKVDSKKDRIIDCQWQTYGCASAIASTSVLSEMVKKYGGMALEKALKIKPMDIIHEMGGLPNRKVHCSVLGDKALKSAINDYFRKSGQVNRIQYEGAKIVDKVLKITNRDIEEAILHGAKNFTEVQQATKVGTGDAACVPEAEQLVKFYREKYYGMEQKINF